jgi:hypothetical protein
MYEVPQNNVGGGTKLCMTPIQNNVPGGTLNCRTNTEITTENMSTENISSLSVSYPIRDNYMCSQETDTDVDIDELTALVDKQKSEPEVTTGHYVQKSESRVESRSEERVSLKERLEAMKVKAAGVDKDTPTLKKNKEEYL